MHIIQLTIVKDIQKIYASKCYVWNLWHVYLYFLRVIRFSTTNKNPTVQFTAQLKRKISAIFSFHWWKIILISRFKKNERDADFAKKRVIEGINWQYDGMSRWWKKKINGKSIPRTKKVRFLRGIRDIPERGGSRAYDWRGSPRNCMGSDVTRKGGCVRAGEEQNEERKKRPYPLYNHDDLVIKIRAR